MDWICDCQTPCLLWCKGEHGTSTKKIRNLPWPAINFRAIKNRLLYTASRSAEIIALGRKRWHYRSNRIWVIFGKPWHPLKSFWLWRVGSTPCIFSLCCLPRIRNIRTVSIFVYFSAWWLGLNLQLQVLIIFHAHSLTRIHEPTICLPMLNDTLAWLGRSDCQC